MLWPTAVWGAWETIMSPPSTSWAAVTSSNARLSRLHASGPQGELQLDLPALLALRVKLVQAELLERDDLEVRRLLAHARDLQRVEDHRTAAALLCVEEPVRDRNRNLVAELGRPERVAVDQNVGHEADPNSARCDQAVGPGHRLQSMNDALQRAQKLMAQWDDELGRELPAGADVFDAH